MLREDTDCWSGGRRERSACRGFTGERGPASWTARSSRLPRKGLLRFDEAAVAVVLSEAIRSRADRLLGIHTLRAADALQLAALLAASEERPADLPLVTLDDRLANAARKEGFPVLPD